MYILLHAYLCLVTTYNHFTIIVTTLHSPVTYISDHKYLLCIKYQWRRYVKNVKSIITAQKTIKTYKVQLRDDSHCLYVIFYRDKSFLR